MSYEVASGIPKALLPQSLVSTGQSIIKKTKIEYISDVQTIIPKNANGIGSSVARWRISSNDIIKPSECYFRFPMKTWNSSVFTINNNLTYLDLGGIHAMISSIVIRAVASNTEIQRIDGYNRIIAQLAGMGALWDLDDQQQKNWEELVMGDYDQIPAAPFQVTRAATGDLISIPGAFMEEMGPQFRLWSDIPGADISQNNAVQKRDLVFQPLMSFFALDVFPLFLLPGGIEIQITFDDSFVSFFRSGGNALTDNQISAAGNYRFISQIEQMYQFDNARFISTIWETDGLIIRDYENQFATDSGLVYSLPNYALRVARDTSVVASSLSFQYIFGYRSVRRAFVWIQAEVMYVRTGGYAITNRTLSHGLLTNINQYSFVVGSQEYPQNKQTVMQNAPAGVGATGQLGYYPVELVRAIRSIWSRRALGVAPWEYMPHAGVVVAGTVATVGQAVGVGYRLAGSPGLGAPLVTAAANGLNNIIPAANPHARYHPGFNTVDSVATVETMCCQFPVDFRRDDSFLCGVDLTQVPLFFNASRIALAVLPVTAGTFLLYNCCVEFDSVLQLTSNGIYVLQ